MWFNQSLLTIWFCWVRTGFAQDRKGQMVKASDSCQTHRGQKAQCSFLLVWNWLGISQRRLSCWHKLLFGEDGLPSARSIETSKGVLRIPFPLTLVMLSVPGAKARNCWFSCWKIHPLSLSYHSSNDHGPVKNAFYNWVLFEWQGTFVSLGLLMTLSVLLALLPFLVLISSPAGTKLVPWVSNEKPWTTRSFVQDPTPWSSNFPTSGFLMFISKPGCPSFWHQACLWLLCLVKDHKHLLNKNLQSISSEILFVLIWAASVFVCFNRGVLHFLNDCISATCLQ